MIEKLISYNFCINLNKLDYTCYCSISIKKCLCKFTNNLFISYYCKRVVFIQFCFKNIFNIQNNNNEIKKMTQITYRTFTYSITQSILTIFQDLSQLCYLLTYDPNIFISDTCICISENNGVFILWAMVKVSICIFEQIIRYPPVRHRTLQLYN